MAAANAARSPAGRFFAHPATLILLGGAITALLSGLLVPAITRSWQNHDRQLERRSALLREELEVKDELVTRIGAATATFLGASQLNAFTRAPARPTDVTDYDRAYARWTVESAAVASQLAAYFPGSAAQRQWRDYTFNMRNVYFVLGRVSGSRPVWLRSVASYLEIDPSTIDGLLHSPLDRNRRNPTYANALRELLLQLGKEEAELVSGLVASSSVLLRSVD